MKKIGIITYHFAINYGAVLQCYALQSFLENLGYRVEILNYVNKRQQENNDIIKHGKNIKALIKNICLLPFKSKIKSKKEKFDIFKDKYLKLSKKIITLDELEKYVEEEKFDYLISGSDQVFNPNIDDFDISFLFPFKCSSMKISYAASTGNATNNDLKKLKKYLKEFEKISIREENDAHKFDSILSKKPQVVCDPVMLMEKDFWSNLQKNKNEKKRYLVCYFLHKNLFKKEFEIASKISKEKNLEIIIINARYSINSFKKGTIYDVGPIEFVNYIKNADFVCTDSFHGTLFSLIFNKSFLCFDSRENKHDSRRKNLLEQVDALNFYCCIEDNIEQKISDIVYSTVNEKVAEIRKNSARFLENLK